MEAKDLRIGDWVCYRGTNIKVTSLYDKGGSNEIGWGDKESTWVNGRTIEPIPLTPEILAKNGFKTLEFYSELVISNANEHTQIQWDGSHLRCKKMGGGELELTCCKYVHQLQDAMRICCIDKEIKM